MVTLPAHVLGVCGPSPIPPGPLVLHVTIRTVDVQHAKISQNNVVPCAMLDANAAAIMLPARLEPTLSAHAA